MDDVRSLSSETRKALGLNQEADASKHIQKGLDSVEGVDRDFEHRDDFAGDYDGRDRLWNLTVEGAAVAECP